MASATIHAFPFTRRDVPHSSLDEVADAPRLGQAISLGSRRAQKMYDEVPGRLHDFEVDMFSALLNALTPKKRAEVKRCVEVFAEFPHNSAYGAAATKLLGRL